MVVPYVCVSRTCGAQMQIEVPEAVAGAIARPRCTACGAEMKKVYAAPDFVKLTRQEAIQRFGNFDTLRKSKKSAG